MHPNSLIESKVFMSPSQYLLARNINAIMSSIDIGKKYVNEWYKQIEGKDKARVSVVHNNLRLDHYIKGNKDYLISWDKSKIDMPVFDLYKLYNNHFYDIDFVDVLKRYEKIYPLEKYERDLLFILINMPLKLEFNDNEFNMCTRIGREIDRLYKSNKIINSYMKTGEK